ncbi:3-methyl-2-oxobutanoate hydroxymethyltransferase [Besnoitia besnoiti]|uniref:3-methyl-2-oxobutanoate hydroxymethyltransferase n=1 Tax=Besnoitia besnoiti TaxID=94643 RepID=A0A2A9MCX1_BESBE|nr:3-methyl-2-oxobutanoate hydroxymethyltransferase [Besnoitia besnoiti]PFH33523.1 3-methyl-2-oxobutanoate hydroxymethyltransferase [Besnoitia besnoiti]
MCDLQKKKDRGEKITMITSYDANSAQMLDAALIDMQLVGDSLANVVLGLDSTACVGLDTMMLFAKHVKKASRRSVIVFDLPYGTYHTKEAALESVISVVKQTGITTVKLEGFCPDIVKALREHVSIVCHLGVQPQTAETKNSRGKNAEDARELLEHSLALEAAGCQMIVLEKVCAEVAEVITAKLKIPTIGIGSGPGCDGQVLVFHDMFGLAPCGPKLKFVKQYASLYPQIGAAAAKYKTEVEKGLFPGVANSFFMTPKERTKFYALVDGQGKTSGDTAGARSSSVTPASAANFPRHSIVRRWVDAGLVNGPASSAHPTQKAAKSAVASGDGTRGDREAANDSQANPENSPRALQTLRRVCIRGGGAMGQFMAWMLAGTPGVEVVLATHRKELKAAVENHGNRLLFRKLSGSGADDGAQIEGRPVNVVVLGPDSDSAVPLSQDKFDTVFICTKSRQTAEAASFAWANARPGGVVATIQNGLEAPRVLLSVFGAGAASGSPLRSEAPAATSGESLPDGMPAGATGKDCASPPSLVFAPMSYGALEQAPGVVRLTGEGEIRVCPSSPRADRGAASSLSALLRKAGFTVSEVDRFDLQVALWQKVAVNACINPLTAILRCTNGEVANPLLASLRRRTVEEVVAVARAQGIPIDLESTDQLVSEVIRRTSRNLSSMLVDVEKGRPTEIDAINGEVVNQGRKAGVPTPVTETLMTLVQCITEQQCRDSPHGDARQRDQEGHKVQNSSQVAWSY